MCLHMPDDDAASGGRSYDLTAEEVSVLLKAIHRYRSSLPSYLRSNERQLKVLAELAARLSSGD